MSVRTVTPAGQVAMNATAQSIDDDPSGSATYDLTLLEKSMAKWQSSPAVRSVYQNIYQDLASRALPGPAVEIGSGCGTAREFITGLVTTDVCKTPFVDHAGSAYAIETVPGGPWETIYALDVLHHLRTPLEFFASAARALAPGGRIVICDPAATPGGRIFYRLFHHEPIAPARIVAPFRFAADTPDGDFANMAMAEVLFGGKQPLIAAELSRLGLRIMAVSYRDVIAYPATGGLSHRALLPPAVIRLILRIEASLPQCLLQLLGLRIVVAIEKYCAP